VGLARACGISCDTQFRALMVDFCLGTAAALLQNLDQVTAKNLTFTGVDIDLDYVKRGEYLIESAAAGDRVRVRLSSSNPCPFSPSPLFLSSSCCRPCFHPLGCSPVDL